MNTHGHVPAPPPGDATTIERIESHIRANPGWHDRDTLSKDLDLNPEHCSASISKLIRATAEHGGAGVYALRSRPQRCTWRASRPDPEADGLPWRLTFRGPNQRRRASAAVPPSPVETITLERHPDAGSVWVHPDGTLVRLIPVRVRVSVEDL